MSASFNEAKTAIQFLDHKLDQLRRILEEFPEHKIWERPGPDMVSLGNLICHVAGSMRDWFENGLGQGHWNRDRQNEFDRSGDLTRAEILDELNETRQHCDSFLQEVNADNWNDERHFRNKSYLVREVLWHQVEHVAYHAGQAAFLRRIVADLPPTA